MSLKVVGVLFQGKLALSFGFREAPVAGFTMLIAACASGKVSFQLLLRRCEDGLRAYLPPRAQRQ